MPLSDDALWWRLLKKSKNSHCLCALAFLRKGVKIVARRASPVTDAVARNSACFERTLFVFVCDVSRVVRARGKGRTRSGTSILDKIILFSHTIFDVYLVWEVHPSFQSGFELVHKVMKIPLVKP